MPSILISPKYSFVKAALDTPNNQGCYIEANNPLPIFEDNDLAFQFVIKTDTQSDADSIMNLPANSFKLKLLNPATITNSTEFDAAVEYDYSTDNLFFQLIRVSTTEIVIYWPHGLPNFNDHYACELCFRLGVQLNLTQVIKLPTNYFYRSCDDCFNSKLEYSCNENAYNFKYCGEYIPNRVRLPLFLTKPQFQDDESIYVKSDGTYKILKSVTKKEYEGKVDYLTESLHEKVKIALSHDNVLITSKNYIGGLRKSNNYEIDWQDFDTFLEAPAKFKALASPYLVRNNNCEVCEELVLCSEITGVNGYVNYDFNTQAWSVDVHSVNWLTPPTIGALISVKFSIREGGTLNTYIDVATVQINHLGQVVNPPTNLFNTGPLDNNWTSVNVRATVLCELESNNNNFVATYFNPANSSCAIVTNVQVLAGSTDAIVTFTEPSPAPALGYDWTLHELAGGVMDFGSISAGTDTINLNNLLSSTDYFIVIVSKCAIGNNSQPVSTNFSTTI